MDMEKIDELGKKADEIIRKFNEDLESIRKESEGLLHFEFRIPLRSKYFIAVHCGIDYDTKEEYFPYDNREVSIYPVGMISRKQDKL